MKRMAITVARMPGGPRSSSAYREGRGYTDSLIFNIKLILHSRAFNCICLFVGVYVYDIIVAHYCCSGLYLAELV